MDLIKKIESLESRIGVIGLGYVGLPLVIEFCKEGFDVVGFDIDKSKIDSLKDGKSYIKHIDASELTNGKGEFVPTTDFSLISDVDCIIICVPTPLNKYREPDLSYVFATCETIAKYIRKGQLISLESTTYPGTTSGDMLPILEKSGLQAGKDFYLAYSPEREDPNNKEFSTSTIPKVVGGHTPDCLKVADTLYRKIINSTVLVSSTSVAEATKLLENIYRAVNIALVNELKMCFDRMDIDVWEVINAAKTKPFGFQAFYPGPGLGGHCIPIDPFYLTWKAREFEFSTRFIELAGEINTHMPEYVIRKSAEALNKHAKALNGSKVLLVGVAYKKNIDDMRESPSLKIIEQLKKNGAHVDYYDQYIPKLPKTREYNFEMSSISLTAEKLKGYDMVLVATDHDSTDYGLIRENAKLIVDTRNVFGSGDDKIVMA
jgi:UDP-N-acetyl-D-glucosamine dehydrogenase